jgi:putative protease
MKLLVGLNKKGILDYLNYTNSFIIGLKDFSINYQEYSIEEIKELRNKYPDIELFISVNKNIFNSDLKLLEDYLFELDKLNISGVLFYDLSVLSLVKKNNLSIPLVWAAEHMTTNYNTCNYYYDKGVEYSYLSSEITVEEIKEIKEKSNIKLISFFFGYPDVSFSKRKLLTNYFLYNNLNKEKDWYTISSDDENKYFIKESKLGTRILYGKIMNGIQPFSELDDIVQYGLFNEELMDHQMFLDGIKIFKDYQDKRITLEEAKDKLIKLTSSEDTVFYYKKTIYKVKDEKKN